ncbi:MULTISPECIES: hypothetical protein [Burkholderia]|uniref:Uncharacterized protein n=1 Tax=Burkholderia mayonis TaxID=1385591 RepID=A0A1B4FG15_9BURK|nr:MULTISPECIES: hypothetical protein [Burkholderia]AOJ02638.1 hypothetical protein WS70_13045 [Burkholderia mayonis]KVE40870.1 hypothetical protein WS69_28405 [Burkholderia sp. BDU5]KVE45755.1 hypothetical protein WS70_03980 [Burkholderia mayonis]
MINVLNSSSESLQVAVNSWGASDNSYVSLAINKSTSFDRTDKRGFVLAVKRQDGEQNFYVLFDSDINVRDNGVVTDHGIPIRPASNRYPHSAAAEKA